MEDNKMIMDDVMSTQVSEQDIANYVANVPSQSIDQLKANPYRKTRTFIRKFNRKVGRNELCPCGSGKKYKNCCMQDEKYHGIRELTPKEMTELKDGRNINNFKEAI